MNIMMCFLVHSLYWASSLLIRYLLFLQTFSNDYFLSFFLACYVILFTFFHPDLYHYPFTCLYLHLHYDHHHMLSNNYNDLLVWNLHEHVLELLNIASNWFTRSSSPVWLRCDELLTRLSHFVWYLGGTCQGL